MTTEAGIPRASAPKTREAPTMGSLDTATRESQDNREDPVQPKINKLINFLKEEIIVHRTSLSVSGLPQTLLSGLDGATLFSHCRRNEPLNLKNPPTLHDPHGSSVHGISHGQEYWSGLPFPSPGDLPDPGIKPKSPALQANSLPSEPPRRPPEISPTRGIKNIPQENTIHS